MSRYATAHHASPVLRVSQVVARLTSCVSLSSCSPGRARAVGLRPCWFCESRGAFLKCCVSPRCAFIQRRPTCGAPFLRRCTRRSKACTPGKCRINKKDTSSRIPVARQVCLAARGSYCALVWPTSTEISCVFLHVFSSPQAALLADADVRFHHICL